SCFGHELPLAGAGGSKVSELSLDARGGNLRVAIAGVDQMDVEKERSVGANGWSDGVFEQLADADLALFAALDYKRRCGEYFLASYVVWASRGCFEEETRR